MSEAEVRTKASLAALLVAASVSCGSATPKASPRQCAASHSFASPSALRHAPACVVLLDEIRVRTFAWLTSGGGFSSTDLPESWNIWRKKLGPYAYGATIDVWEAWDEELELYVVGDERSDFTSDQVDALKSAGARSVTRLSPGALGVTAPLGSLLCLAELDFVRQVDVQPKLKPAR